MRVEFLGILLDKPIDFQWNVWGDQMVTCKGTYYGSTAFLDRSCRCSQEKEGDDEAFWKHGLRLCLRVFQIQEGFDLSFILCNNSLYSSATEFPPTTSAPSFTPPCFFGKFMHIIYSKSFICLRFMDWDRQRSMAFVLNVVEPSLLSRLPQSGCEVSNIKLSQWVQYQASSELQLYLHTVGNLVNLGCKYSAVILCWRK